MLLRLLKSLRLRRRAPSSPRRAADEQPSRLQLLSRLASFASGQELVVTGKEAAVEPSTRAQPELPIMDIVARAAALCGGEASAATMARVHAYTKIFSALARPAPGINVLAYHVDLPAGQSINYVDAKFAPQDFDYLDILARFIDRVRMHCPGAMVYLATSPGARYRALAAADVVVVELAVNSAYPMYERAAALLAYAESAAFTRDTVFLDSDAFVNRPLDEVFSLGFDVALTYREGSRLMPINEGAIFLAAQRPEGARDFLRRRMATYDRLIDDAFITGYYGDVRRWRGGQLSLNGMALSMLPCSPYRMWTAAGARIRLLPCDTYNFAPGEGEAASSLERLADRYIVHFKGSRKYALVFAARAEGGSRVTR